MCCVDRLKSHSEADVELTLAKRSASEADIAIYSNIAMSGSILLIFVIALIGIWCFLAWQPGTKNKGIEALPSFLRSLYAAMENDSILRVRNRGSEVEFSFVRIAGENEEATVELRIPRADWSVNNADKIFQSFLTHGFQFRREDISTDLLASVTLEIPNIWDSASGATGAHAARILIQTIGLGDDTRFDVRSIGETSRRILTAKDHA